MFMWGSHSGIATWQLYDSNCALYQVILMDGAMGSLDVPNTCHLLCKSAFVESQALESMTMAGGRIPHLFSV